MDKEEQRKYRETLDEQFDRIARQYAWRLGKNKNTPPPLPEQQVSQSLVSKILAKLGIQ